MLDAVLKEEGIERIPGAHCYEFFATGPVFAELAAAEPGTFYLTDFLLRHFERLVLRGLGLDRHPELHSDLLRQLPQARVPGAGAQARCAGAGARDRRAHGSRVRVPRDGLRHARRTQRSSRARPGGRAGDGGCVVASLIVISWRDIPAQVIVKRGRDACEGAALAALSRGGRPRRDARRQGQLGCLSRRLAAQRAAPLRR